MTSINRLASDRLSTYRTSHIFESYAEFETVDEFIELRRVAREKGIPVYILGNGSNTLFATKRIRSLVVRNKLPPTLVEEAPGILKVSSSTPLMHVLKYCERRRWDSFYFLASVPAAIGGALAMNAGGGVGATIYDYVKDVTFLDGDELVTLSRDEIERAHRRTRWAGVQDSLIVSATFEFEARTLSESEIKKRARWASENQDLKDPNCGSVFRVYHGPILRRFRALPPWGIDYPWFATQFSRRVNNWIITRSTSSLPIVCLIRTVQIVHRLAGKRAEPEVVEVR